MKRVLRPGGLAIFETPNPENVLVGSNFFYLDPTHHHPLPSELMQFLFESRGFDRVEVLNLHQWDAGRVAGEGELAERSTVCSTDRWITQSWGGKRTRI